MTRIEMNLARRPFLDTRKLDILIGALLLASILLAWFNGAAWLRERAQGEGGESIAAQEQRIAALGREIEVAEIASRTAVSSEIRDEVEGVNLLIAERTFSWVRMLERLEASVPGSVAFNSVSPTVKGDSSAVELSLAGISLEPEGLLRLIESLYTDPAFSNPFPSNESSQEVSGNPDGRLFSLRVGYDASKAVATPAPKKPEIYAHLPGRPQTSAPPAGLPKARAVEPAAPPPPRPEREVAQVPPEVAAPLPASPPAESAPRARLQPAGGRGGLLRERFAPAKGGDEGVPPGGLMGPGAGRRRQPVSDGNVGPGGSTSPSSQEDAPPAPKGDGGEDQ